MKHAIFAVLMLSLSACAVVDRVRGRFDATKAAAPVVAVPVKRSDLPGTVAAKSAETLDASSSAERSAALSAGSGGGAGLGSVVVSLGSPAEQGFWLRTSLVTAPARGRVVTDEGASVAVDLLPDTGAAQLSLAAYRALGLPLTGLPRVEVFSQ